MNAPHLGKGDTIAKAFDRIRADYDMSKSSRFVRRRTGVNPSGSSADYHYRNETKYYQDIEQARDMDRNDSLTGILADRRVDNIIQQGFTLEPQTGDKQLDLDLWERWEAYSNNPDQCDIAGELTWKEIERLTARSADIDGDIIVVGTEDGSFQIIEGHLIQRTSRQQDVFLGVEADAYGKRLRYHLLEEIDEHGTKRQVDPIDVRNEDGVRQLFHIYNPRRVYMTRGVTMLAPIFGLAGMLEDVNFAKLVQQQMVSMWAVLHEYAPGGASGIPISDDQPSYGEARTEGDRRVQEVSPGMEYFGEPGETLKGFSPNVPNSEYFQQVRLIMQIMGVNFGLPLCLVLMDGSETNFSGWRGAVDEARKGFVADQLNHIRRLNKPAYEWWLSNEIKTDAALRSVAKADGFRISNHVWHPPTWSYIEPVSDAEGDATQLRNALTSPRRLHAARGKDWEQISEEITADNVYAISNAAKTAEKFNAENPKSPPLTWRDLIPLVMPQGQTLALQDPAIMDVAKENAKSEEQESPTGEMAGISRQQWNRNRKAIKDVLDELAAKKISEAAARVFLENVGLAQKSIEALLLDASDGTVDTPEVNADV